MYEEDTLDASNLAMGKYDLIIYELNKKNYFYNKKNILFKLKNKNP